MLVHKGGKIKNWGGECRDVTPTKSLSQNIRVDVKRSEVFVKNQKKYIYFFLGGGGGGGGGQGSHLPSIEGFLPSKFAMYPQNLLESLYAAIQWGYKNREKVLIYP